MIVVISCAGRKKPDAGYFRTDDEHKVMFVADPGHAPRDSTLRYARPDDRCDFDTEAKWWQRVVRYNAHYPRLGNPFGLFPAGRLYENPVYGRLEQRYGLDGFYILSAGWGLIPAGFLTPQYDITFNRNADASNRRRMKDSWTDLNLFPVEGQEPVMFFGGKHYVPLFSRLTKKVAAPRIVWHRSAVPPTAPGCCFRRYETATRTNWHYECVHKFLNGELDWPDAPRSKASPGRTRG